jgi:hypothetical protein
VGKKGKVGMMSTKHEWKDTIRNADISLFPDVPEKDKEHIAGYVSAKVGDIYGRKEAQTLRNKLVKNMRSDGWETWIEPASHIGGSPTVEFAFSASRVKGV